MIFDCDGTLVDSTEANYASWRDALAGVGVPLARDFYRARTGLSAAQLFADVETAARCRVERAAVHSVQERHFAANVHLITEVTAVAAVARALSGRVPIAVASGGPWSSVVGSLRHVGLLELFDVVVTAEDSDHPKPAPDLYLVAAGRLATDPRQCVALEDSEEGLAAALAAGMDVVDVRRAAATVLSDLADPAAFARHR